MPIDSVQDGQRERRRGPAGGCWIMAAASVPRGGFQFVGCRLLGDSVDVEIENRREFPPCDTMQEQSRKGGPRI